MDIKSLEKLELDKILNAVGGYAVTDGGKSLALNCSLSTDLDEVRSLLSLTEECEKLLFVYPNAVSGPKQLEWNRSCVLLTGGPKIEWQVL